MVSLEPLHSLPDPASDAGSSPRISFSSDFFDESNFITICPNPQVEREREAAAERARIVDFEFLSENKKTNMITADELICEGKLLPFWDIQIHHAEKLIKGITLKSDGGERVEAAINKEESRITWFIDEDPSPRPPKCTVLWKELLKLKKHRPSTLSSSASSSSSSGLSPRFSVADVPSGDERKEGVRNREKCSKRTKKGQERERARSSSIRIRPVLTVPICTQAAKSAAALPPLFSLRRARLDK